MVILPNLAGFNGRLVAGCVPARTELSMCARSRLIMAIATNFEPWRACTYVSVWAIRIAHHCSSSGTHLHTDGHFARMAMDSSINGILKIWGDAKGFGFFIPQFVKWEDSVNVQVYEQV